MQHDFKREAAKTSVLLSRKIDKYKHLAGEEILPLDQSRINKLDLLILHLVKHLKNK